MKVKMQIIVPNTYHCQPHMHKISHIQTRMTPIQLVTCLFVCLSASFIDFRVHDTAILYICLSYTPYKVLILASINAVIDTVYVDFLFQIRTPALFWLICPHKHHISALRWVFAHKPSMHCACNLDTQCVNLFNQSPNHIVK